MKTLNEMGGRGNDRRDRPASGIHADSLERLRSPYNSLPSCPSDLTAESAVLDVIGSVPGYAFDDVASGKYATYRRGKVSLPRVASGVVCLADVLPSTARSLLMGETGALLNGVAATYYSSASCTQVAFD